MVRDRMRNGTESVAFEGLRRRDQGDGRRRREGEGYENERATQE
jgi:hypothetical protein